MCVYMWGTLLNLVVTGRLCITLEVKCNRLSMGIFFSFLSVLIKIIMYNGLDDINFIIKLYKSYKLLKINDKHKKKV